MDPCYCSISRNLLYSRYKDSIPEVLVRGARLSLPASVIAESTGLVLENDLSTVDVPSR